MDLENSATTDKLLTRLSDRERAFVVAYCGESYGNAKHAAEAAGYARRSGARIRRADRVDIAIDSLNRDMAMNALARRSEVERRLARTAHEWCQDGDTGRRKVSLQADAQIAKMNGYDAPVKVEVSTFTHVLERVEERILEGEYAVVPETTATAVEATVDDLPPL